MLGLQLRAARVVRTQHSSADDSFNSTCSHPNDEEEFDVPLQPTAASESKLVLKASQFGHVEPLRQIQQSPDAALSIAHGKRG